MANKPREGRRAQRLILTVLVVATLLASGVLQLSIPNPELHETDSYLDLKDRSKRHSLYELNGIDVGILHGNIFELDRVPALMSASIAVSAKFNLGETFYPESANSQLYEVLTQGEDDKKRELDKTFESLAKGHETEPLWVDTLPRPWLLKDRKIYLMAGLAAAPKTTTEPVAVVMAKPRNIFSLVQDLCRKAKTDQHVALTFVGTGAARVDEGTAISSIIGGINDAAAAGDCPTQVTVVLFSDDKGKTEAERDAWLAQKGLLFQAAARGDDQFDTHQYAGWRKVGSQTLLIIAAPLLAALISTWIPRIQARLWWGPIVTHAVKWAVLVSGFYAAIQASLDAPSPLAPGVVAALVATALIAPLWEWLEMARLLEQGQDEPSRAV